MGHDQVAINIASRRQTIDESPPTKSGTTLMYTLCAKWIHSIPMQVRGTRREREERVPSLSHVSLRYTDDHRFADTLSLFHRLLSKQSYVFITCPLSTISPLSRGFLSFQEMITIRYLPLKQTNANRFASVTFQRVVTSRQEYPFDT